jgi:hypothetical protein
MKFWPVEVRIADSWVGKGLPNTGFFGFGTGWMVVNRVKGMLQTWQPGQTEWDAIYRSRRLDVDGKARVWENSEAFIGFPDRSGLSLKGPVEVRFIASPYPAYDQSKVIDMRMHRVGENVLKFFGKQYRFEIKNANGSLGARG